MIYLLRHGETVWNASGRFQGRKDSPLTQHGIEQANQMGMLLSREIAGREAEFKSYVRPLGRAKETAARIAKIVPLTFEEEPRLIEVSVGLWDGMTLYEIGAEYPDALNGSDAFDWFSAHQTERVSITHAKGSALGFPKFQRQQSRSRTDLRADCYAVSILVCPSAKCLNCRCHNPTSIGSTTANRNWWTALSQILSIRDSTKPP